MSVISQFKKKKDKEGTEAGIFPGICHWRGLVGYNVDDYYQNYCSCDCKIKPSTDPPLFSSRNQINFILTGRNTAVVFLDM